MLTEYSITPDVFDKTCYSMSGACQIHLQNIKEILLNESLVSNLYDGEWKIYFENNLEKWDPRAKELFKKLNTQNRICYREKSNNTMPTHYADWINEAITSNLQIGLDGIIISHQNENSYSSNNLVCSIEKLSSAPWWQNRSPSTRVERNNISYLNKLNLILKFSNSIMFIDPHIDPKRIHYKKFIDILKKCYRENGSLPDIEIHKVSYSGSGVSRVFPKIETIESEFNVEWSLELKKLGIKVKVFVWNDFHDRFLISDLIGISLSNGFDITTDPNELPSLWSRLGRKDKDDIQREFDPSVNKHNLKYKFEIG